MKFKYEKKSGDISDRELIVVSRPSSCFFGIDVTDVAESKAEQIKALRSFIDSQKDELFEFVDEMGLEGRYRNFRKDRIVS